jgi:hypothetical protein
MQLQESDEIALFSYEEGEVISWEDAQLFSYYNTTLQAIVVPIQSTEPHKSKSILAYYSPDKDEFEGIFVFVAAVTDEDDRGRQENGLIKDKSTDGFFAFYDTQGALISGARYKDDRVVGFLEDEESSNSASDDYWGCSRWCLKGAWSDLPLWLKIACGGSCGACLDAPNVVTCPPCVACLTGYAIGCHMYCE